MASVTKKLVDSNLDIAEGGRADRYWNGRTVKRSSRYSTNRLDFNIDQDDVIKRFSLKGFEYGNWLNNNDRYDRLLATNDSLTDLAKIIGSKNIGLDGTIGIAFGARGTNNALAHFEPHTWMINLTKEKGFGSLAHEYGHALDYFFGTYIDQSKTSSALSGGSTVRRNLDLSGGEMRILAVKIVNTLCASNSYKYWQNKGEYWIRRNEIFARTFEMWIAYQCRQRHISNNFLAKIKYESALYPQKSDFMTVLPLMNHLIHDMALFLNNDTQFVTRYSLKKVDETKLAASKQNTKQQKGLLSGGEADMYEKYKKLQVKLHKKYGNQFETKAARANDPDYLSYRILMTELMKLSKKKKDKNPDSKPLLSGDHNRWEK